MNGGGVGGGSGSGADTVGSLLADIGTALSEALRMLMFADKRQWGPDEFEQVRALECALDEARKDFQEMGPLVNGQLYYENDRKAESLDELRHLRTKFDFHRDNFRDWLRTGGPINPVWARETALLQRELHRAQCRAAARIFAAGQDLAAGARCLGAFQVRREHRRIEADRRRRRRRRQLDGLPPWHQHQHQHQNLHHQNYDHSHSHTQNQYQYRQRQRQGVVDEEAARQEDQLGDAEVEAEEEESAAAAGRIPRRNSLEELAPCCNAIGKFERYRDRDVAFVCDFCDGFLVWENLESMPSTQQRPARGGGPGGGPGPAPPPSSADYPHWQAVGRTVSGGEDDGVGVEQRQERRKAAAGGDGGVNTAADGGGEEKTIVFAPIAIANHVPPAPGDFEARILCPYCDEYTYIDQGDADEDEVRYTQDEGGFPDVAAFQEHLEWSHTPIAVPAIRVLPTAPGSCSVM